MPSIYKPPQGKGTYSLGVVLGVVASGLIFLAIPLTQIFTVYEDAPEQINTIEVALPPPPHTPDEPPPPLEPEQQKTPLELNKPPQKITLEQLNLALNPGIGASLTGDFALPNLDIQSSNLGTFDIFDLGDLDIKPQPKKQASPQYPSAARRRGQQGFAIAEFIIDTRGKVTDVTITQSSDPVFNRPTIQAIRSWEFAPGEKDGRKVKTRTRVKIPYTIQ